MVIKLRAMIRIGHLALSLAVGVFKCHQYSSKPFKENESKMMAM